MNNIILNRWPKLIGVLIVLTGLFFTLNALEPDFKWFLYEQDDVTFYPVYGNKINIPKSEKELYIFFKPEKKVFLYLLLKGPEDTFSVVFPDSFNIFAKNLYTEDYYIIPEDGLWEKFTGEPGDYELYFIFSKSRLKNLEIKITEYRKKKEKNAENEIKQLVENILAEIDLVSRKWYFSDNKQDTKSSSGIFRNDDVFPESESDDSEWANIFDISAISESAYNVLMDAEGYIILLSCKYTDN